VKKKIDFLVVALTLFTGTPCFAFVPSIQCGNSVIDNFTCSEIWGFANAADGHDSWSTPVDDKGRANSGLESSASGIYAAGREWIGRSTYYVSNSKTNAATTLGKNRAESITTANI
jgi:rhamnogalacturonyl hydrolase YesR